MRMQKIDSRLVLIEIHIKLLLFRLIITGVGWSLATHWSGLVIFFLTWNLLKMTALRGSTRTVTQNFSNFNTKNDLATTSKHYELRLHHHHFVSLNSWSFRRMSAASHVKDWKADKKITIYFWKGHSLLGGDTRIPKINPPQINIKFQNSYK